MKLKLPSIELLEQFFNSLTEKGLELPNFKNSTGITIFSDYSGERSEDKFYSYSFFIIDDKIANEGCWDILNLRKQEKEWKDNSFIEYKKLSKDKVRRRILPRFLRIFDQFEGLVLTILISKECPDFFIKVNTENLKTIDELKLGNWKLEVLRKSSNILSVLSFLVKRFANKDMTFTWYSDRDDIFGANQLKKDNTLDMLSQFLHIFEAKIKDNNFRYISDKHSLLNSDFLSISDLSAGAVLDYYQTVYQGKEIKDWTKQIIGWMSLNSTNLKKVMVIGTESDKNKQLTVLKNY